MIQGNIILYISYKVLEAIKTDPLFNGIDEGIFRVDRNALVKFKRKKDTVKAIQAIKKAVMKENGSDILLGLRAKLYKPLHVPGDSEYDEEVDEETLNKTRRDFYNFITAHDKRRGTNFQETFPELVDFYNDCKKLNEEFLQRY